MLEDQALDRVYRIGQTKEVTTTRYIVAKTLEEVCLIFLPALDDNPESYMFPEHPPSATKKEKLSRASLCAITRP